MPTTCLTQARYRAEKTAAQVLRDTAKTLDDPQQALLLALADELDQRADRRQQWDITVVPFAFNPKEPLK